MSHSLSLYYRRGLHGAHNNYTVSYALRRNRHQTTVQIERAVQRRVVTCVAVDVICQVVLLLVQESCVVRVVHRHDASRPAIRELDSGELPARGPIRGLIRGLIRSVDTRKTSPWNDDGHVVPFRKTTSASTPCDQFEDLRCADVVVGRSELEFEAVRSHGVNVEEVVVYRRDAARVRRCLLEATATTRRHRFVFRAQVRLDGAIDGYHCQVGHEVDVRVAIFVGVDDLDVWVAVASVLGPFTLAIAAAHQDVSRIVDENRRSSA